MKANLYVMENIRAVFEHIKINLSLLPFVPTGNLGSESGVHVTTMNMHVGVINKKNLTNSKKLAV